MLKISNDDSNVILKYLGFEIIISVCIDYSFLYSCYKDGALVTETKDFTVINSILGEHLDKN